MFRRLPFQRLIQAITNEQMHQVRWQSAAVDALQESVETYVTDLFRRAQLAAVHAKRITVQEKDIDYVSLGR